MVNKSERRILSTEGRTLIRVRIWEPEEIKGIFQLAHGMVEHIDRYDDFASFIAENGYLVVGNDHLGHGQSVISEDKLGYFCENDPSEVLIDDMDKVRREISSQYPDKPYFILGHSMGSFCVRNYINKYSEGLAGAIIMSTGDPTQFYTKSGKVFAKLVGALKGMNYRSKLLDNMSTGVNNKKFKNDTYTKSWLSKDKEKVRAYLEDPKCGYMFTVNGFVTLAEIVEKATDPKRLKDLRKDLPIFVVGGDACVLGEFGKVIPRVVNRYKEHGMTDVEYRIFKDDRHEILNELDRDEVYKSILDWLNSKLPA